MGAFLSKKKKEKEEKVEPKKKQARQSSKGRKSSEAIKKNTVVRKNTLISKVPTINPNSIMKKDRNIKQFYKISGFNNNNMINMEIKKAVEVATGLTRSIKIINKALVSELDKKRILYEMKVLRLIQHPHIGKIHDFRESAHYYYIVIDYLKANDLLTQVSSRDKPITELEIRDIMRQILSAVSLLHKEGIIHGDLQAKRITFEDDMIKIVDFASVKDVEKINNENRGRKLIYYSSPEMLTLGRNDRADEWACGIIAYLLITGKPPVDMSSDDAEDKIKDGKFDLPIEDIEGLSENGKEVLKALLTHDHEFRLPAGQVLQLKWFDHQFDKIIEKAYFKNTVTEIKKYQFKSKLQEAVYLYMTKTTSTQATKKQMLETFQKIDKDGDGFLTRQELMSHFNEIDMNYTRDEVNHLFDLMDTDGDNQVSFDEFVAATVNKERMLTEENIFQTFRKFDKDQNGKIEIAEFFEVLKRTTFSPPRRLKSISRT